MARETEEEKMLKGELYSAFSPDLIKKRDRCTKACHQLNTAGEISRRRMVELWRNIQQDSTPLPPVLDNPDEDAAQFEDEPWVTPPVHMDYGTNVKLGKNVYFNFGCTLLDICIISIGSRTVVGPNTSFYGGSHPLDPELRNGTKGPEYGKEIHIGEDCWIGGNVIILPGITIGNGAVIGAGSVVTKNVPALHIVAGNPARIIREITKANDSRSRGDDCTTDAENIIADLAS